jgi:hypothetical protein
MKTKTYSILVLIGILLATTVMAAPRVRERYSTDPGRDLERIHVKGKIETITGQKALLVTESGSKITVHLGPQHYWREKGYSLRTGVTVEVSGWGELYDEDGGYCYVAEMTGPGFFFDLADSQGYPRWADGNEYDEDNWRPSLDVYEVYYGAPPWFWTPAPRYWHRPVHPYYGPRHGFRPPHHREHGRHWR